MWLWHMDWLCQGPPKIPSAQKKGLIYFVIRNTFQSTEYMVQKCSSVENTILALRCPAQQITAKFSAEQGPARYFEQHPLHFSWKIHFLPNPATMGWVPQASLHIWMSWYHPEGSRMDAQAPQNPGEPCFMPRKENLSKENSRVWPQVNVSDTTETSIPQHRTRLLRASARTDSH